MWVSFQEQRGANHAGYGHGNFTFSLDVEAIEGTNPKSGEEEKRKPDANEPFAALAFKIATDPYVGRLCFTRAYSGTLNSGTYVMNTRSGSKERISLEFIKCTQTSKIRLILYKQEISQFVGFKDIKTGDTLCAENAPIVLESMDFPDPVIGVAIEPKTQKDLDKLGVALGKLAEEDPTFTVKTDEDSGQTIISGMGELHLDIIIDRLRREFSVECNQGATSCLQGGNNFCCKTQRNIQKQSGGRGKFADIQFEISPVDSDFEGEGLQFVNEIKGRKYSERIYSFC